ncbi:hypothetical protein HN587_02550 [Candidatus Woesearchaeota archaeon]|jgi:hypothetical protein|nr:hypothetical protein [Candidatus Woesearchaeota archaeon]
MRTNYTVLVVDDNFSSSKFSVAIIGAQRTLRRTGHLWTYANCVQDEAVNKVDLLSADAVIIDNDYGHGMVTVNRLLRDETLPIAYVSAYDLEGLRLQEERLPRALHRSTPEDLVEKGVVIIRKNLGSPRSIDSLVEDITHFLVGISSKPDYRTLPVAVGMGDLRYSA